eukprot:GHUV01014140.1.p1 GENE.GHUV01014140.1~~GHUV01014140.1.p1  ORF type:complete len:264 (+),score=66.52 GHUV01014140.1:2250-3041(+)
MAVRTIKYLVVDNIVDDVPEGAPEIDASVGSTADVAGALVKLAGVPSNGDIYLRTARPDGSLRWQPLSSLTALPDEAVLTAKVVRGRGPTRPAGPQPVTQTAAPAGSHGMGHALGGLFKKLAVGGGSGGGSTGGFGHMGHLGRNDADEQYQEQLREQQMIQELEDGAMRRDVDDNTGDWTNMDNNAGPDPEDCDHDGDRSSSDHDGDHDSHHDDNDNVVDNDNDNDNDNDANDRGDWQAMDNDAGPEPDDNDNGFDDNDNDDN